jgi:hypothetical protein
MHAASAFVLSQSCRLHLYHASRVRTSVEVYVHGRTREAWYHMVPLAVVTPAATTMADVNGLPHGAPRHRRPPASVLMSLVSLVYPGPFRAADSLATARGLVVGRPAVVIRKAFPPSGTTGHSTRGMAIPHPSTRPTDGRTDRRTGAWPAELHQHDSLLVPYSRTMPDTSCKGPQFTQAALSLTLLSSKHACALIHGVTPVGRCVVVTASCRVYSVLPNALLVFSSIRADTRAHTETHTDTHTHHP